MRKAITRSLVLVLLIGFAACGGGQSAQQVRLPYYNDADLTPRWLSEVEATGALHTVSDFSLTDQTGARFKKADLVGKLHVAGFFFASCGGICPAMIGNLQQVQQATAADPDVLLVSYSVTPEVDTVEVLARYARSRSIDARNWRLLTGDKKIIYGLARSGYFAESKIQGERGVNEFLHTETVYLVDGGGHIRGVYNGTRPLEMDRLIEDIRTLQATG